MIPPLARRLTRLPPYLFVEIDRLKQTLLGQGRDVIDLGVGDPDTPTPDFIVQALVRALRDARHHRYPSHRGLPAFRVAIADWMKRRFGVVLDPDREILPLIGSKEGIAHLPLAFVNPGESVWMTDPGYPPYRTGTLLAGGRPVSVPLRAQNRFLPDLEHLSRQVRGHRPKLFFLNYPNNPTTAVADLGFFRQLARFALAHGVPICHDAAYSEIFYGKTAPPSFLSAAGAKEIGLEFHSLSKTFNMTGWRIGWAAGNRSMIAALAQVKSNIDSGIFQAIQMAGIEAFKSGPAHRAQLHRLYRARRDTLVAALKAAGWPVQPPEATFYVWAPIPKGASANRVASRLLQETRIVATPGTGFGTEGEGYIRFSLTLPSSRLQEAARRIRKLSLWRSRSSA